MSICPLKSQQFVILYLWFFFRFRGIILRLQNRILLNLWIVLNSNHLQISDHNLGTPITTGTIEWE